MKFKKVDREFLLTDDTVNVYGFRLKTEGYQIDEFKKNPIGYHMHARDKGVLVKWDDLRVKDNAVYGKPVINMSHDRAQQTVDEIENGFLNAASVGHLVILDYSRDDKLKVPGQKGPTVTKWYNRECSLVDVPGNFNSLALYDEHDNEINLADFTKPKPYKPDNMEIIFTSAMLASMNLKADTSQDAAQKAFNDLVAKADKAEKFEQDLKNLKAEANKEKVQGLIADALAAKKITKAAGEKLETDYAENPEGLKNLLADMTAYTSVKEKLDDNKKFGDDLADKSWNELHESGVLPDLKAKNPELFKLKFKEEFGKEPD